MCIGCFFPPMINVVPGGFDAVFIFTLSLHICGEGRERWRGFSNDDDYIHIHTLVIYWFS